MKTALINNDVIVALGNVTDSGTNYLCNGCLYAKETHTLQSLPDSVGLGHTWDGNAWQAPIKPLTDELREAKLQEIRNHAESERNAGFTSNALGTSHQYGSTLEDRINLIGANQAGQPTKYNCKETGQQARKTHTPAQMNNVLADGFTAIQVINDKESALLDAIDAATTVEELDAVVW